MCCELYKSINQNIQKRLLIEQHKKPFSDEREEKSRKNKENKKQQKQISACAWFTFHGPTATIKHTHSLPYIPHNTQKTDIHNNNNKHIDFQLKKTNKKWLKQNERSSFSSSSSRRNIRHGCITNISITSNSSIHQYRFHVPHC